MSLQWKALIVVVLTFVFSITAIFFASQYTLLSGYEDIEQNDMRANVQRAANSFFQQSQGIVISARAYAVWDDMYEYISSPDPAFLDYINLTPEIFATHKVNLIAILDAQNQTLFLKMYDLQTAVPLEIPPDLFPYLLPGSPLIQHAPEHPEISGLILLGGKPMFVASLASLHTDFSGEPRGAVIFGRYLDQDMMNDLSEATRLSLSAFEMMDNQFPDEIQRAIQGLNALPADASIFSAALDDQTIAGYTYISTIEGEPAFLLKVSLPRSIYLQGLRSFRMFVLLMGGASLLFLLVTTFLMHVLVISPINRLNQQISAIRSSGHLDLRLEVRGKDELASLGRTINEMLQSLQESMRELEMVNRELESYAYTVSHDLRAPLRAADSFVHILMEDHVAILPPEAVHLLQRIGENTKRMGNLIEHFLRFSQLGRQALRKTTLQPSDLVRRILDDLKPTFTGREIEFIIQELPSCRADEMLLQQVYVNLLDNAIKYTSRREKAVIEVGCVSDDGLSVYYVRDNGAGFDMKYADNLFKMFKRLHTNQEFEGIGIGLAITQRIIVRHGGNIWAESTPESGTTFYFTLAS